MQWTASDDLTAPPEELFAWFLRPRLAAELLPAEARLTLVDAPEVLTPGATITLRSTRAALPQTLVHRVERVEPPTLLVLVQSRGPFRDYRSEQTFVAIDGGTRLTETIAFSPPGGVLGLMLTEARIRAEFDELHRLRRAVFAGLGWIAI